MSLHADIFAALAGIAGGRVYWQTAEHDAALPFVVYRMVNTSPQNKMNGAKGLTNTEMVFECWAQSGLAALTLRDQVRAAIDGAATLTSYETPASGEDYEPTTEASVEPVSYGFWHS